MKLTGLIVAAFFILASAGLRPATAAEIININYKYKVAFADLTESDVRAGELVDVVLPDGKKAQMKVVETFPVMVKLTLPDNGSLSEDQFAGISVGTPVTAPRKTSMAKAAPAPVTPVPAPQEGDIESQVETYSPSAASAPERQAKRERPLPPAPAVVPAVAVLSTDDRMATLEARLDQMTANNLRMAENITHLLEAKNKAEAEASEAVALMRQKEIEAADAIEKLREATASQVEVARRARDLEAANLVLLQDKAAQAKEIENLKQKLGELRKKLAKMVDIVNSNTKAYEKQ